MATFPDDGRVALQALDPSRMIETAERIDGVRRERARVAEALSRLMPLEAGVGPVIQARPSDPAAVVESLRRFGLSADAASERVKVDRCRIERVGQHEHADRCRPVERSAVDVPRVT